MLKLVEMSARMTPLRVCTTTIEAREAHVDAFREFLGQIETVSWWQGARLPQSEVVITCESKHCVHSSR